MIGPVQLVVLGFQEPDFRGEILAEFERLRDADAVRLIDGLAVYKDAEGDVAVLEAGEAAGPDGADFGVRVGALVGLSDMAEEPDASAEAEAGATSDSEGEASIADGDWDVLDELPPDSAAALVLLEHRWAVPLRDAIVRAGGFPISNGFISPFDLVEIGLVSAAEAEELVENTRGTRDTSRRRA